MTRETRQGVHLRLNFRSESQGAAWILPMLTALTADAALTYGLGTAFGLGQYDTLGFLLASGAYVCLIYGLILRFRREQWFFPAALAFLLLLVLAGGRQVLEGYRLVWNQLRETYTAGTGLVLPQWQPQLSREQWGISRGLFSVVAGSAAALLCCLLSRRSPAALAVLVSAAVLGAMAFFGTKDSLPGLAALAAAALILMCCGWRNRRVGQAVGIGWVLWGAALCAAVLLAAVPGVREWSGEIGQQAQKSVHSARYETEYTLLPEGDFADFQQKDRSAQPMLKVTMSEPQAMYLRGFVGCTLEGNTWRPIDTAALAQDQNLLYWLNQKAFFPAAQYAAAAGGQEKTGTVTIQNLGACSRYFLVPFTLASGELLQSEDLRQDSLVSAGGRTYSYRVVSVTEIEQVLENLQTSEEKWVRSYRKAESAYRDFVYRNYLQVPDSVMELLGNAWDAIAAEYGASGSLSPAQAQTCVLAFLSRAFPEEGTQESLELPLPQAAGTSFQYATAAVMTLRHFGIPARYAEGYVISREMTEGAEQGGTLTLDDSSAQAWVEVYQDGIGWIPMELTPGMGEMLEPQPGNGLGGGDGQSDQDSSDTQQETLPKEENTEEPQPQGGTVAQITRMLTPWVLLLLPLLLLWIRRSILRKRREREFALADAAQAIPRIFGRSVLLLENLGLCRGNGSMAQLLEPARQRFGEAYAQLLNQAIALNAVAMFSSHPLSQAQREKMLEFYAETRSCLEKNVKWYRRLWMKWIRCLY